MRIRFALTALSVLVLSVAAPAEEPVKVSYYNLKAEKVEMTCHDLPARVWQHEIDHLNGVLFIDKMGPLGRMNSKRDLEKFIADFEKDKKKGELPADLAAKL